MTIISTHYVDGGSHSNCSDTRHLPRPPPLVWHAAESPFKGYQRLPIDGYSSSSSSTVIVIDNGASLLRAGWAFDKSPRIAFPATVARYRDRKINRTVSYVGYNAFADATTRGQIRNAFEPGTNVVGNWDVMEGLLDYTFASLGISAEDGGVGRSIVMTEPVANLGYSRRTMTELLFECYSAPAIAYGIDSLFSYRFNGGRKGLVVSSSHTATHLIPVFDSKPIMSSATRLNWGGSQGVDYLLKILKLKYPTFPAKFTDYQMEEMIQEHCYVSKNFQREISTFLDWSDLKDKDHVIQYPFTEQVIVEKSEEELTRIAERKKESGRRLQEQAAKMRLEKLIRKEQTLEYYKDLQQRLSDQKKKEIKRLLDEDEFKDENQLEKTIHDLEKSIRKARNKDVDGPEHPDEEAEPSYPLLSVADEELDEAGLKEKRHQRLMKSGYDARVRAKAEKELERARVAEEERRNDEYREANLQSWLEDRRSVRQTLLQRIKERDRLKADLGNRKSLASQMRMKTLANLASDQPGKKRRRGLDDDNFGANDDDWGVYRTVAMGEHSEDEEEEDLVAGLKGVEEQLLKYDPTFNESNTLEAQSDWTQSLMHAFLRGPRPFDPDSQQEAHQIHLNVERIRVPEVVFQPSIAGLDQAGIVDIVADITNHGFANAQDRVGILGNIFLTGGNTMFAGFNERLRRELRAVLPVEASIRVRKANDPILDAWKGAAQWAADPESTESFVTREDYQEKGADYMKEHNVGNAVPF